MNLVKFLFGIIIAQVATYMLILLAPAELNMTGFLRLAIPLLIIALVTGASAQNPVVAPAQKNPVILSGGTIHTGTGEVIENGIVAFAAGKITYVGKSVDYKGDKSAMEIIDVTGKQVYPGFGISCIP